MDDERALEARKSLDMERIVKIETVIAQVTTEQTRLSLRQDKQDDILAKIAEQQNVANLLAAAIRERTDMHSKTIEDLQKQQNDIRKGQVDIGEILSSMKIQLSIYRNVAYIIGMLVAAYLFSHFIK